MGLWTAQDAAHREPVGADSSSRRYFRLRKGRETVILMENIGPATPGHDMLDYLRIGAWLRSLGLNAPEVYEADEKSGTMLIEDFGDISFKAALEKGAERAELYGLATDVLSYLRRKADVEEIDLPDYYASHVHKGRRRVVDWFMPAVLKRRNADGLVEDYLAVWDAIEATLPPCPQGFLHIDYHFENLMWMPQREKLDRCGILDFQGAMSGPLPYDLANLLEDARVDVPADLRRAMLARYCADMGVAERKIFESWYRVLATQFHCRVAGQFIKLAIAGGKPRYLEHLPRVAGYLREGLKDPLLKPLAAWFAGQGVDFGRVPEVERETAGFIRSDAF